LRMIWLLRHGDAEAGEGKPDAERELTEKGRRQSRDAGRALKALGVELDVCISSPKVRAKDTAALACDALEVEVTDDDRLAGGDFDPLEIAAGRGEVMLVGHEPDFSRAVAAVTGSRVKMKKGGLAAIDDHLLHGLYRPKDLRTIAGG
jgi:phosphohistidine phosphatase